MRSVGRRDSTVWRTTIEEGETTMTGRVKEEQLIPGLGVKETTESDGVLRWDGEVLYVEHDVYHNGQLVHRKYRRKVTQDVARALLTLAGAKL
jgi:hypothetical protein